MNEERREAVAMGISMMGMYMMHVIEDQGLDKALEYYNKVGYGFGSGTVAALKEKFGDETPTPEGLKEAISANLNGFGQDFEIKNRPDGIDIMIKHCPFYEGLQMVGMDNETITKFCHSGGGGEYAAMKDGYSMLEPFSTPRSHAGGVCKEGYNIKK